MNMILNTMSAAAPAPTSAAPAPGQDAGVAQQPFANLLELELALPPLAPEPAADAAPNPAQPPRAARPAAEPADEYAPAAVPDAVLMAAMAMPLMPLPPAQLVQALQAAQPLQAGAARKEAPVAATPAIPLPIEAAAARQDPVPARPALHADTPAPDSGAGQASDQDQQMPAPVLAAGAPSTAPASAPAPDTLRLAGPPTAWRQSLQDALGERLHLQLGRNAEQAVIRLDPPQLGRIDIAIRHSAGALEVSISASNGEVLRQLQGVSENLRNDLAQRQYSDVAVTVAPAPKSQAAPFGEPQQQGRPRQERHAQEEQDIGGALAEAGHPGSVFTLS
jgi:flagellar hook-length control protein FliK